MNNLQQIIVIGACLTIPVSIWGILYNVARIVGCWHIRHELGEMPTREEIQKLYEQNNEIVRYGRHSPTDENSR